MNSRALDNVPRHLHIVMTLIEEILKESGFSQIAIDEVKAGKLHNGGNLDASSEKELSVQLAFHIQAKIDNVKTIFLDSPAKKEYDPTVESIGKLVTYEEGSRDCDES